MGLQERTGVFYVKAADQKLGIRSVTLSKKSNISCSDSLFKIQVNWTDPHQLL